MPVIASPTHYLFQIVREGITFLACTQLEMPPLMGIEVNYTLQFYFMILNVILHVLNNVKALTFMCFSFFVE